MDKCLRVRLEDLYCCSSVLESNLNTIIRIQLYRQKSIEFRIYLSLCNPRLRENAFSVLYTITWRLDSIQQRPLQLSSLPVHSVPSPATESAGQHILAQVPLFQ